MIDDLLMQLNRVRGVGGTLVLSGDGQVVAGVLREGFDEAALAASVATALGSAQRLADALGHGTPQAFDINGDQGSIQILPMGGPWLAIAIDRGVNVALLHLEARPVVERIAAALKL